MNETREDRQEQETKPEHGAPEPQTTQKARNSSKRRRRKKMRSPMSSPEAAGSMPSSMKVNGKSSQSQPDRHERNDENLIVEREADEVIRQKIRVLQGSDRKREYILSKKKARALGILFFETIPYIPVKHHLSTLYTQYIFKRISTSLAINFYLAQSYPATMTWKHWTDIMACTEKLMQHYFREVEEKFEESEAQAERLMDEVCLTEADLPAYINRMTVTYAVTTPHVRRYLDMMTRLDRQARRLEGLWAHGSGVSGLYVRHECLRLRSAVLKMAGKVYQHSDRVRRVINGKLTAAQHLTELQNELEQYTGLGLKETDEQGESLLMDGEQELSGPLVGDDLHVEGTEDGVVVTARP
ncbi:MAG: hypothetical protein D6791_02845 [Chloroflexi bacterium]|nr:MAG: hypothetical protein D6791_02845 [Chloroflexota bacterium]